MEHKVKEVRMVNMICTSKTLFTACEIVTFSQMLSYLTISKSSAEVEENDSDAWQIAWTCRGRNSHGYCHKHIIFTTAHVFKAQAIGVLINMWIEYGIPTDWGVHVLLKNPFAHLFLHSLHLDNGDSTSSIQKSYDRWCYDNRLQSLRER